MENFKSLTTLILTLLFVPFSSVLSLLAGMILVTPVIAWMNYTAEDGPIFPAPLVAFVVVAPICFMLVIFQTLILVYEGIDKRLTINQLLVIGIIGGGVAGLIPYYLVIAPYQISSKYQGFIAFAGLGIFLGMMVFSSHWALNKVKEHVSKRCTINEVRRLR